LTIRARETYRWHSTQLVTSLLYAASASR